MTADELLAWLRGDHAAEPPTRLGSFDRMVIADSIEELRSERDGLRRSIEAVANPDFATVELQALLDCGLNGFAVVLLAESFKAHPNPRPVKFALKGVWVSLALVEAPMPDREAGR